MASQLFRRKPIDKIVNDVDLPGDDIHSHGLKRVLTLKDLTFFGIAAIIGAGSFSSLGGAVFSGGPGVVILFIITGIACAFTAFCYSEFASRIPVAGSAYTYAYASFGELFAWIIGWALIMEYSIGNIYVAFSWSDYFTSFLEKINIHVPEYLSCSYREAHKAVLEGSINTELLNAWNKAPLAGGIRIIFDLPALIINLLITYLVYRGIKESRNFSNVMVILKLAIVALIIIVGGALVFSNGLTFNWTPPNDEGVKSFMPNGFGGVMMAVSGVFFAYIGFDAVSVLAEESKNPQRDLPRGMILSLVICTVVYILLTLVLTGAVNFRKFDGVGDPLAFIFEKQNLNIGWMQLLVSVCAVVAMTSVLLVFQMGQPRMWMSMSRDGLMPPAFQKIHPKFKTPSFATVVTGFVVGVPILFTDKTFVLDFTSIATLFAFVLVCGGVLLLPRKEKVPGRFSIPYISGRFIFPLLIAGAIVLISSLSGNYFKDKLDFSFERKVDGMSALMPGKNMDTAVVAQQLETYLQANTGNDSTLIKLAQSVRQTAAPADKFNLIQELVAENDTTQSKTAKVSIIIFWLLMIGLSIFTIVKKFSLIPLLGVSTCLYLLTGMTFLNWLWFGGWLALGLIFYFLYGYKKSRLANT
jgi:basic amino acid/polyamine antiporter, APA family